MSYLTLFTLGMVQYANDNWDEAISRFSSALNQINELNEPLTTLDKEFVYSFRGISFFAKSDYEQAMVDFNQVLKLKPNSSDAYNNRGVVYTNQGNYA